MYYVPDGTTKCGFYECKCCRSRFLSLQTMKKIPCPYCEQDADMEIGVNGRIDRHGRASGDCRGRKCGENGSTA